MTIDSTRPHIGRIYDSVLGGQHNFEVDRAALQEILKILPAYPEQARLNRWFLQLVAARWAAQGVTAVLDLASGLPTQGHFNDALPAARILFADNDPLSVSYGTEILQGRPHQRYIHADLRQPEALIEQAAQFFGIGCQLAVGFIGVCYLLSDAEVRHLLDCLYKLCAPGSTLAVTFLSWPTGKAASESDKVAADKAAKYANMRLTFRSPEQLRALIQPWHVVEMRLLEEWLEMPGFVSGAAKGGVDFEIFGAVATR